MVSGLSPEGLLRLGEAPRLARELLPPRPVTRFAPSVTGALHLGHVVNAIFTWGLARAFGGSVILRLEDHDRGRHRPEHEAAILEGLEWLGLEPDRGSIAELRAGRSSHRQSDSGARYEAALDELKGRGARTYACDCSRSGIEARAPASAEEPRYDGHCRDRGLGAGPGRGLRVELPAGELRFRDALLGDQVQSPQDDCGDLLLRDRQGCWTYHFAVVVDDRDQGVDLVVRGLDLLSSTGRQSLLAGLLSRPLPPVHAHHPLVADASGRKLSKSAGDASLSAWRASGGSPAELLGLAAHLAGLQDQSVPLVPDELGPLIAQMP